MADSTTFRVMGTQTKRSNYHIMLLYGAGFIEAMDLTTNNGGVCWKPTPLPTAVTNFLMRLEAHRLAESEGMDAQDYPSANAGGPEDGSSTSRQVCLLSKVAPPE